MQDHFEWKCYLHAKIQHEQNTGESRIEIVLERESRLLSSDRCMERNKARDIHCRVITR